jgi:hypothetical protein
MKNTFIILAILAAGCAPSQPASPAQPARPAQPALDVVELSATDARDRMAAGTLTSEALTKAYLDRIAAIDDAGPQLNAVIEINPKAMADAAALDAERKAGKVRGPMHGIPVLIKDNVDIAGMVNSAGSLALADNHPATDAFVAKRLRDAGAVILGKTNLSEWAELPLDPIIVRVELARRSDEEPVCARSQSVRLELRHRLGDRRQPCGGWCRHRDRRQHHLPGIRQRTRGTEADRRTGQPQRHHPDLGFAGHRRPDGQNRVRCCPVADGDGRC